MERPVPTWTSCHVFLALCPLEAELQGAALKHELELLGHVVHMGSSTMTTADAEALTRCQLVVILGTQAYSNLGDKNSSTSHQQLQKILAQKKAIFLVDMCEAMTDSNTVTQFPDDLQRYRWQPRVRSERPPIKLVHQIAQCIVQQRRLLDATEMIGQLMTSAMVQRPDPASHTGASGTSSGLSESLTLWLAEHELRDLAPALKALEIVSLQDAVYAAKKGLISEVQLRQAGAKRLAALRFLDLAKEQP